jgi:hypothetical protein
MALFQGSRFHEIERDRKLTVDNMQLTTWKISLSVCRDSEVSTATGYGLDGRGVGVRVLIRA